MPRRIQNVQQNFAAGVLSPRYSAAVESAAFPRGLKQATNFLISSQGGSVYRQGMQYISDGINNAPFRVMQFKRGGDESDILVEVAEGSIRLAGGSGSGVAYIDKIIDANELNITIAKHSGKCP